MQSDKSIAESPPPIRIENLGMRFDKVTVLEDIDFTLKEQEIHSIVGVNGAGKSTLMKILSGVHRPSSGKIHFYGDLVAFKNPSDAQDKGISMVYQDLSLVPSLTVSQNVMLACHQNRKINTFINKKGLEEQSIPFLKRVGAENSIDPNCLVESLSSGQQQIVEIAKALASDPKILILDEPTASLSVKEIEDFLTIIKHLKEQGISIIYITHYLQDVFKVADRVTVLRDGHRVLNAQTSDIDMPELIRYMIGTETSQIEWKKREAIGESEEPVLELCEVATRKVEKASLKIYEGQVVGIAGLLGSGRTELFDAIIGIDPIQSGELRMHGKSIKIRNSTEAIRAGITLVPENRRERGLVLDFAVQDNMVISVLKRFKNRLLLNFKKIINHVDEKIQSLNIKTQHRSQIIRFLSGGNQQKVVVSKCLSTEATILLLDDPTFGVDVRSKNEIMTIIRNYVAEGNAAIFVSSEFNELAEFCDTVYIMKHGEIVNQISDNLSEEQLLLEVQ